MSSKSAPRPRAMSPPAHSGCPSQGHDGLLEGPPATSVGDGRVKNPTLARPPSVPRTNARRSQRTFGDLHAIVPQHFGADLDAGTGTDSPTRTGFTVPRPHRDS